MKHKMKVISVYNRKGGLGKTATTVNLSSVISECFNKKVLVVDVDSQANASDCLLSTMSEKPEVTLVDYINNNVTENLVYRTTYMKRNKLLYSNVSIIPSNKDLDFTIISDTLLLKKLLKQYENDYDYCIIDCPPSLSEYTSCALCASDYILVPMGLDMDSINGYSMVLEAMDAIKENGYNDKLQVLGILLNAYDARRSINNQYLQVWKDSNDPKLFKTVLKNDAIVVNARDSRMPVQRYAPSSEIAKAYFEVAKEFIRRINKDIKNN